MSRYIDAEKFEKDLDKRWNVSDDSDFCNKEVWRAIKEAPSADVVEVVRCKDCKYYEHEMPGMVYCPNLVGGWTPLDYFCALGERRDDTK